MKRYALWLALLALSTLATGAHWGLDVAAGFALAALVLLALRPYERREVQPS